MIATQSVLAGNSCVPPARSPGRRQRGPSTPTSVAEWLSLRGELAGRSPLMESALASSATLELIELTLGLACPEDDTMVLRVTDQWPSKAGLCSGDVLVIQTEQAVRAGDTIATWLPEGYYGWTLSLQRAGEENAPATQDQALESVTCRPRCASILGKVALVIRRDRSDEAGDESIVAEGLKEPVAVGEQLVLF